MPRNLVFAWVAAASVATFAGCGSPTGLYPVYGHVNYKGEPAAGATVSFYRKGADPSAEQIPRGEVQPDGSFRLESGDLGRGAAPGEYVVLVEWRQGPLRTHRLDTARSVGKAAAREGKPILLADDRLNGRYSNLGQARLVAEVQAKATTLPPFELAD